MAEKALSGIRVVEDGNFISAAYCTKLLADLGAEVIKIEHPEHPDESRQHGPFLNNIPHPERSGLFLYLNANKLDVTLNLDTASGREIMMRLLKNADIFVENNPLQLMKDRRLDYDSIKAANPHLIMTSITPFGQTGPYKDYKGYDINIQAAGGVPQGIGSADREPLAIQLSQGQYHTALCAAISSLMALWARPAGGQGQHIDISAAEVLATLDTGWNVLNYIFQWKGVRRTGYRAMDMPYPNHILPCKDGYIVVGAGRRYQWEKLLELMGNPEWAKDPRFQDLTVVNNKYGDEVDAHLIDWLKDKTKAELFALSEKTHLNFAPVKNIGEVVAEPQLAARGFYREIERADTGALKYPGVCYHLSETPAETPRPAPLLGEHNELIYCERLGFTKKQLVELRRGGVI